MPALHQHVLRRILAISLISQIIIGLIAGIFLAFLIPAAAIVAGLPGNVLFTAAACIAEGDVEPSAEITV